MMKRSFIVAAVLLLLTVGFFAAEESTLIDFGQLVPDILEGTENRRTVMDYSTVAGASFTQEQKDLLKTSLAHANWEVVLNSSSQNPQAMAVSNAKGAPVNQDAQYFAGETVLGVRANFPTWGYNASATIQPPFDIPIYEPYAQVSDDGVVQDPTDEDRATGFVRFEEGYGVVRNVSVIKSIAVNTYGMNFPHGLYVLLTNEKGETNRYFMGYLNFDGWKQMVWTNPDYLTDVRAREIRIYPVYPTALPSVAFAGFLVTRDAAHDGGDFIGYFKDVKIVYDRAVIDTLRDIEHEDLWGIQTTQNNAKKAIEVSRFGDQQINRFIERERMAVEAGYTTEPGSDAYFDDDAGASAAGDGGAADAGYADEGEYGEE